MLVASTFVLGLLPPPALGERRHRGLARRRVAVCAPAIAVIAEGERPEPRRSYRRSDGFHDAADDDAISEHVEVVVVPLARGPRSGRALRIRTIRGRELLCLTTG